MGHLKEQAELMELLIETRNEWLQAQNYFENVSEPDLVDYAIYRLEAAKKKYMYLLKRARASGFENTEIMDKIQKRTIN